ncbi:hypothetical protein D3C84_966620 [compost metagenome]
MAEHQAAKTLGVQQDGGERMVVDHHQVAIAFFQCNDGVMNVGGHHSGVELFVVLLELREPLGQEGHGQAVAGGDLDRASGHSFHVAQRRAQPQQSGEGLSAFIAEGDSRGCELDRVGAPVHQLDAHPFLK